MNFNYLLMSHPNVTYTIIKIDRLTKSLTPVFDVLLLTMLPIQRKDTTPIIAKLKTTQKIEKRD
jgi:hypothetical protein